MPRTIQLLALEGVTALDSLSRTYTAMIEGVSALAPLEDLGHPQQRGARFADAGEAEDDPALRILGRHGRSLEPVLRAAHAAGHGRQVARERLGLFLALGMVDAEPDDLVPAVRAARDEAGAFDLQKFFAGAFRSIHPLWPLAMLNNVAAGQFAIDLDIRGDNLVLASDADAGVRAVLEAAYSIQSGAADAALVAGASEAISPFSLARFALEGRPATFAPGEASGAWFLASPACASALGARPQGYVRGGATAFGHQPGGCGPTAAAWSHAIVEALADAHATSDAIDLLVCDPQDPALAEATAPWANTARWSAQSAVGSLGGATAFVEGALALRHLRHTGRGSTILLLAGGAAGCAGALVLEAA